MNRAKMWFVWFAVLFPVLAVGCAEPTDDSIGVFDDEVVYSESDFEYGFERHNLEALEIHKERKARYEEMTGGASAEFSDLLIGAAEAMIPMTREYDERAAVFHELGIPIISRDLVSMSGINDVDTAPRYRGAMTDSHKRAVDEILGPLVAISPDDFEEICRRVYAALIDLEQLEEREQIHLAMTRHLLESAGLTALHGIEYAAVSDGETVALSRDFVRDQLHVPIQIGLGTKTDERANEFHQQGVGIVVNELPPIPFLKEYESTRAN